MYLVFSFFAAVLLLNNIHNTPHMPAVSQYFWSRLQKIENIKKSFVFFVLKPCYQHRLNTTSMYMRARCANSAKCLCGEMFLIMGLCSKREGGPGGGGLVSSACQGNGHRGVNYQKSNVCHNCHLKPYVGNKQK